jgi:breast cancer 2 susceptibility protein
VTDFTDQRTAAPILSSSPRQHPSAGHDDPNDPFTSTSKSFTGFISASASHLQHTVFGPLRSDPDIEQNERDVLVERLGESVNPAIGFTSASDLVTPSVGFASASSLVDQPVSITRCGSSSLSCSQAIEDSAHTTDDFATFRNTDSSRPLSMFTSLGKKNVFQPSAAAMKIALEKVKRWAAEDDSLFPDLRSDPPEKGPDVTALPRQAPLALENVSPRRTDPGPATSGSTNVSDHANVGHNIVETPGAGQLKAASTFRSAAYLSTPTAVGKHSLQTPSGIEGSASMKSFKSPLLQSFAARNPGKPQSAPSFLHPVASTPTREPRPAILNSSSFPGVLPISGAKFSTPTPIKGTPMRKLSTKKFVTPFKAGMRPGELGQTQLRARYEAKRVGTASGLSTDGAPSRRHTRARLFDLGM